MADFKRGRTYLLGHLSNTGRQVLGIFLDTKEVNDETYYRFRRLDTRGIWCALPSEARAIRFYH